MSKINEAMDVVAGGMLNAMTEQGWVKPFVGLVNEKEEVWGDHYQPAWTPTTDEFMEHARDKCKELIQSDGASLIVVAACVCLFKMDKKLGEPDFGIGGLGDGSLPKNMEAALQMSGKEAKMAVAVMATTSGEMAARVYVRETDQSMVLEAPIQQRLLQATKALFDNLPWPTVN